ECGDAEPPVDRALFCRQVAVAQAIRAVAAPSSRVRDSRGEAGRKMLSRREAPDPRQAPVSDDMPQYAGPSVAASDPKRKIVYVVEYENMPAVVGHGTPFAAVAAGILWRAVAAAVAVSSVGQVLRPGVGESQGQAARVAPFHAGLERVVFRRTVVGPVRHVRDIRI